jgi:hypothetical protein
MSFLLKFLIPLILAVSFFAWQIVDRDGWDAATFEGGDPWAPVFGGLGGASVPMAIALLIAGITRIFSRETSFLNAWLVIFLIAFTIVAITSLTAARKENAHSQEVLSPVIIDVLKSSHLEICRPTIEIQSRDQGFSLSEKKIELFCKCLGDAYFASFTRWDLDEGELTETLPARLLRRRGEIQLACLADARAEQV